MTTARQLIYNEVEVGMRRQQGEQRHGCERERMAMVMVRVQEYFWRVESQVFVTLCVPDGAGCK